MIKILLMCDGGMFLISLGNTLSSVLCTDRSSRRDRRNRPSGTIGSVKAATGIASTKHCLFLFLHFFEEEHFTASNPSRQGRCFSPRPIESRGHQPCPYLGSESPAVSRAIWRAIVLSLSSIPGHTSRSTAFLITTRRWT